MAALWSRVGQGEIVNSETGQTNWTIDWAAVIAAFLAGHELVSQDDRSDIFDALVEIRRELMRPPIDRLYAGQDDG